MLDRLFIILNYFLVVVNMLEEISFLTLLKLAILLAEILGFIWGLFKILKGKGIKFL